MIVLRPLAPDWSSSRFLIVGGIDSFCEVRDAAEMVRHSASLFGRRRVMHSGSSSQSERHW